jgi:hypothetical protein
MIGGITNLALSLAMLAAAALAGGGLYLVLGKRDRTRGALMIGVALVLIGNVLIWVWPIGAPPS